MLSRPATVNSEMYEVGIGGDNASMAIDPGHDISTPTEINI